MTKRVVLLAVAAAISIGVPAAPADAAVSRSQREAVVFVADLSQGSGVERAFYDFIEFAAVSAATGILGPAYNRVTAVQGSAATLTGLRAALIAATNRSGVRAVDLIFVTHGLTGNVAFSNGRVPMTTVRDHLIANLTATQRAKLRAVFSTACFGATHRTRWIQAGFDVASGSIGVYADSAASYVPFLTAWALGQSFGTAVSIANGADPLRVNDNAARLFLQARGSSFADQVNSIRQVTGSSGLTIDGDPVGTFRVTPTRATAGVGQTVTYTFSWTVPKPRTWRSLRSMDIRLRDERGTAIAVRWDEALNTFSLVDDTGRPTAVPKRAGQRGSLSGRLATLELQRSRVVGNGRTATLTLALKFKAAAKGRTFRLEVAAEDDRGRKDAWQRAGTLAVK